nr:xylulose kinase-1 [Tanacetum cinerariifolium]
MMRSDTDVLMKRMNNFKEAEQRLLEDYFANDDTPPKYLKENFRRRQRIDAIGRNSIGPILKITSAILQLAYGTTPDAFDEYFQIAERCSRYEDGALLEPYRLSNMETNTEWQWSCFCHNRYKWNDQVLPPKTAEEVVARERERKTRSTLLMALPEDHLPKFYKMADAKEMWEAIKSMFGGNDESKKMQKYLLKQHFEGFSVSISEGLHKGYDRMWLLYVLATLAALVGNKMHKAFTLPVIDFPLAEEVPTASEESSYCQKKRDATAKRIALLVKVKE